MAIEAVTFPGRLVGSTIGRARRRSLQRAAAEATLALGQRMAVLGTGDPQLRGRIAVLDEQLRIVAKTQAPTASLLQEREELLNQLARKALVQSAPPPGAEADYYKAVEAQRALEVGGVPMPGRAGAGHRKFIAVGAVAGAGLLVLVLIIAWPRSGPGRDNTPERPRDNSPVGSVAPSRPNLPPPVGTVTFAEYVNLEAGIIRREGRRFTTGDVWMVIRSPRPFGDTRLVISYLPQGGTAWRTLRERPVDPNNDTLAVVINLADPGRYSIRVQTSRGERIAEDVVEVTNY